MKNKERKLKKWVRYTLVIIIITLVLIPVIKLLQRFGAEDKEAYNNCMQKTNNSVYCNNIIYGN